MLLMRLARTRMDLSHARAKVAMPETARRAKASMSVRQCLVPCTLHSTCIDTDSSFLCPCNDGWHSSGDLCKDKNECALGEHTCASDATCANTDGAYSCTCNKGFKGTGKTCNNINECQSGTSDCDSKRTLRGHPWRVRMPLQSMALEATARCARISTSALPRTTIAHSTRIASTKSERTRANAMLGSRATEPPAADDDECLAGTNTCSQHAACTNRHGSYDCACNPGWVGNGKSCVNVDECVETPSVCSEQATCTDNDGGYACKCADGYSGNGTVCRDVNECTTAQTRNDCSFCTTKYEPVCGANRITYPNFCYAECEEVGWAAGRCTGNNDSAVNFLHTCSDLATCNNLEPGYGCDCNDGWKGDGKKACNDIDECLVANGDCMANSTCR